MSYDNTSNANRGTMYTVNFRVDLTAANYLAFPNPNGTQTEATMAATRSTWISFGPHGAENRKVIHDEEFTAYNEEAYYLKQKYEKTASNLNGVLVVVSEVA